MRVYFRWPYPIVTIWPAVAIAGCLDSQALPNGNTKPRQAYRTESATTVPLPDLAYRLAFTRDGTLFSTNTDGSDEQALPLAINVSGKAAWSPDGAYLALTNEADGDTDTFILPLDDDGTPIGRHNITRSPAIRESSPAWSPDGGWIAFTSRRSGNSGIYLITADGASIAQLTVSPSSQDFAAWLPLQSSEDATTP